LSIILYRAFFSSWWLLSRLKIVMVLRHMTVYNRICPEPAESKLQFTLFL
jgi:hypothetical protein